MTDDDDGGGGNGWEIINIERFVLHYFVVFLVSFPTTDVRTTHDEKVSRHRRVMDLLLLLQYFLHAWLGRSQNPANAARRNESEQRIISVFRQPMSICRQRRRRANESESGKERVELS